MAKIATRTRALNVSSSRICITPNPEGVRCSTPKGCIRSREWSRRLNDRSDTKKRRNVNACPQRGHAYDNPRWGLSYRCGGPKGLPTPIKKKKKKSSGATPGLEGNEVNPWVNRSEGHNLGQKTLTLGVNVRLRLENKSEKKKNRPKLIVWPAKISKNVNRNS